MLLFLTIGGMRTLWCCFVEGVSCGVWEECGCGRSVEVCVADASNTLCLTDGDTGSFIIPPILVYILCAIAFIFLGLTIGIAVSTTYV